MTRRRRPPPRDAVATGSARVRQAVRSYLAKQRRIRERNEAEVAGDRERLPRRQWYV
jgi:hypothetical protein